MFEAANSFMFSVLKTFVRYKAKASEHFYYNENKTSHLSNKQYSISVWCPLYPLNLGKLFKVKTNNNNIKEKKA